MKLFLRNSIYTLVERFKKFLAMKSNVLVTSETSINKVGQKQTITF